MSGIWIENTPRTPFIAGASESGSWRSPCTISAPDARRARAFSGFRTSARTGMPAFRRARAVAPPCLPVAPVTRTGDMGLLGTISGGARHFVVATLAIKWRPPPLLVPEVVRAAVRRPPQLRAHPRRRRGGGRGARCRRVAGADRPDGGRRLGDGPPPLPEP